MHEFHCDRLDHVVNQKFKYSRLVKDFVLKTIEFNNTVVD